MDVTAPIVRVALREHGQAAVPLNLQERLLGFVFDDADNKADRCTITLDNWDLALFDDRRLLRGTQLEVQWGYPGRMTPPRLVVVQKVTGFTQLSVEANAKSIELAKVKKIRSHSGRYSDIAVRIAAEYGYTGEFLHVEPTATVYGTVNQRQTDAEFITWLARKVGYVFFVDFTGFHFHKRKLEQPIVHAYTFRGMDDAASEIIGEPRFDSDFSQKVGLVRVRAYNPATGETFDERGSRVDTPFVSLGEHDEIPNQDETPDAFVANYRRQIVEVQSALATETNSLKADAMRDVLAQLREKLAEAEAAARLLAVPGRAKRLAGENVVHVQAEDPGEAREKAAGRFYMTAGKRFEMKMTVIGRPEVGAKTIIHVGGISAYLSGRYYIKQATHRIMPSNVPVYACELVCLKDAAGKQAEGVLNTTQGPPPPVQEPIVRVECDIPNPTPGDGRGRFIKGVQFRRGREIIRNEPLQVGGGTPEPATP